jgi:catechol 2,3-dioxygenase
LVRRAGPAIHHFAYIVNGIHEIIRACDVAGGLGIGGCVEFGPGT